jgi:ABC-type transporter Mla subunit MlaD
MHLILEIYNLLVPFSLSDFHSFSADSITAFFILVSLIFAGGSLAYFLWKLLLSLDKDYFQIIKQTPAAESVPETVQVSSDLLAVWRDYRASFVYILDEMEKTSEDSNEYFGANRVLDRCMNIRYWTVLPGIFVGWGILGTFVGLTYGVGSFDTGSTEAIRGSISQLLAGMNTAFATSIWGMLLSIVFNIVEKWAFGRFHRSTAELIAHLNHLFKLSSAQEAQILQEKEQQTIKECVTDSLERLFTLNQEGQETRPSHFFRDLLQESKKQSQSLGNFSTDLAEVIGDAISNSMSNTLGQLSTAIQEMRQEKGKSTEEISLLIVDQLQNGIMDMMTQLQETVSGSTQDQLQELAQLMIRSGEALESVPREFQSAVGSFREEVGTMAKDLSEASGQSVGNAKEISSSIVDTMKTASEKLLASAETLEKSLAASAGHLGAEANRAASALGDQFRDGVNVLGEVTQGLKDSMNEILAEQNKTLQELNNAGRVLGDVIKEAGVAQGKFNTSAQSIHETLAQISAVGTEMDGSMKNIQRVQSEAIQLISDLKLEGKELAAQREIISAQVSQKLERLENLNQSYVEKFQVIEQGLKSIFEQIGEGLQQYQAGVETNLNSTLSAFSDHFKTAVGDLGSTVEEFEEYLGKVSDGIREPDLVKS